jgi:hypothetical protein
LASHRGGPGSSPGGQVGFVVDKVALEQVFSEYFGSSANLHFTNLSIIIITQGNYNRPFSGRGAEWIQFGLYANLKKNCVLFTLLAGFNF